MIRFVSGVTDQYIYFFAADATDGYTPETGLTAFTVYRSRDGAAAAAFTTPTINETSSANMPGTYELLLDEDMTIGTGNDSEAVALWITCTGMRPVFLQYELYRPKATLGLTLNVGGAGNLTAFASGAITAATFAAGAINAAAIAADAITDAKVASDVTIASVTGAVGSVTGAVGSVTGNVGGNVTGSVGSVTGAVGSVTAAVTLPTIPANWITASGIATDAIGADEIAASAVTEIQAGLASQASSDAIILVLGDFGTDFSAAVSALAAQIVVVDGIVDEILIDTGTTIPAAIAGLPTANENAAQLLSLLQTNTGGEAN